MDLILKPAPRSLATLTTAQIALTFVVFAMAYAMSYGLRAIQAVLGPGLAAELQLSASALGLLSAAYFITFASIQLPLGTWLDRYGARRVEPLLLLIAAAGCGVFAMASSVSGLFVGRALIGLGVSACLMAPYSYFRQCLPAQMQPRISSWLLMAGTSGAMSATVPVQWLSQQYGWRSIFVMCAVWLVLCAIAIVVFVRDTVSTNTNSSAEPIATGAAPADGGYRQVFSNPTFIAAAPHAVMTLGGLLALQTLWAGPWLRTVSGQSADQAANVLFVFFLALVLTYAVQGAVLPRLAARGLTLGRIAQIGAVGSVILLGLIIVTAPAAWAVWLWPALGLTTSMAIMTQTVVGVALPKTLAGRAFTAYNLVQFGGAFAWQWAIGAMIDASQHWLGITALQAHRLAFTVLCAAMLLTTLWLLWRLDARAEPS